jgi:hypothetical protein
MAVPGLITCVLTSKYFDHLPLYDLEQIADFTGVPLVRSTSDKWVGLYGFAMQPRLIGWLNFCINAWSCTDETSTQQLALENQTNLLMGLSQ